MTTLQVNELALEYRAETCESKREILFEKILHNYKNMMNKFVPAKAKYRQEQEDAKQEMSLQLLHALEKWNPARASFITCVFWYFRKAQRDYYFKSNMIKVPFSFKAKDRPEHRFTYIDKVIQTDNGSSVTGAALMPDKKIDFEMWMEYRDMLDAFDKLTDREQEVIQYTLTGKNLRNIRVFNAERILKRIRDKMRSFGNLENVKKTAISYTELLK